MDTVTTGTVKILGILEVGEDVAENENFLEEPNLTESEMVKIERQNARALKSWNIVACTACRKPFDMLTCKYNRGSLVCPHCNQTNI